MNFAEFETHDRRLVLLRGLNNAAQYRTNSILLRRYADAVGHVVGSDRIEHDLTWLAEQGLITTTQSGGITVATLTSRGMDVATGRVVVPGVAKPQPEA